MIKGDIRNGTFTPFPLIWATISDWIDCLSALSEEQRDHITGVNLNYNRLTAVPSLNRFPNLRYLEVHANHLMSIEGLSTLTGLEYLCCSSNMLTSLDGLSKLVRLEQLKCSYNALTQLDDLSRLCDLEIFVCQCNSLKRLPDCSALSKLQQIDTTGNTELPIYLRDSTASISEINQWKQNTLKHQHVRKCIRTIVALLDVIKKKRSIRDVLGIVIKMVWAMRFHFQS